MGNVSQRHKDHMDCLAGCTCDGGIRTSIMRNTKFSQNEREYGIHWNAFYTLALTKFGATILSLLCKHGFMLFAGGVVFAVIHEVNLQHNTSNFVMNANVVRNTLFKANREGICSILGFISIYLFSMLMGHHLRIQNDVITRKAYFKKLKVTMVSAILLWVSVFSCIFLSISIARVTCNLGYILLVLAIAQTMTGYYMLGFHSILSQPDESYSADQEYLPSVVEAVNKNGLVYFVVANLLTGGINLCLEETDYVLEASIIILSAYMFLTTIPVQILHYYKKRIG
ncbi:phosphatidylinositol-glycan biosynthesis class W protein isoform X2 [Ceratitis capitata]|uniref:phosphatidylinositol-glycan biosynthesis class W protein isoform X2 n=1 Tax=Ceratitis capitata TaxID=7213 RepID=UPI000A115A75|nr:phosphatidylinositol-glycan biosynthesis class W protein isoform X2 [Ceratitis capitata]